MVVAAVLDGVVDWLSRRDATGDDAEPIGLLTYLLLKRIDDLAYGIGLWWGVARERNARALKPQIRT
ncbi:membrane sugar transferase [Mycobacterium tuberculosis]|nr:membrane sugar transferase [Mycobacterium tuberculosis]